MSRDSEIDYEDEGVKAFLNGDADLRDIRMLMRARPIPGKKNKDGEPARWYSERRVDLVIKRCMFDGLELESGERLASKPGRMWVADPAKLKHYLDWVMDWKWVPESEKEGA